MERKPLPLAVAWPPLLSRDVCDLRVLAAAVSCLNRCIDFLILNGVGVLFVAAAEDWQFAVDNWFFEHCAERLSITSVRFPTLAEGTYEISGNLPGLPDSRIRLF